MCRKPDYDPGYFTKTNQTSKRKQIHQFLRVARILFVKYLRYAAYGRVHKRYKRVHRCYFASIKLSSSFYNWHKSCLLSSMSSIKVKKIVKNFGFLVRVYKTYKFALRLDERPVSTIHFVVKTTSIAQIMAVAISSP